MERILIVYGTTHGHTERIADHMAEELRRQSMVVTVARADEILGDPHLEHFDGVIVAASVLYGRHQRYVEAFAREHAAELAAMPTAFVSSCGALAGNWPEGSSEATKYRDNFFRRTGWRPTLAWSVAGSIAYTKYSWPTRLVMKYISRRTARPTDTSRDWEFTDWDAVTRMAREFAEAVEAPTGEPAPAAVA
jgi:menaquinone-dependent protoporphyrinogen oxidase